MACSRVAGCPTGAAGLSLPDVSLVGFDPSEHAQECVGHLKQYVRRDTMSESGLPQRHPSPMDGATLFHRSGEDLDQKTPPISFGNGPVLTSWIIPLEER